MIGFQLHKALKLCPPKNQLGMVLSGAHGITNAISCANIYPIQIIQIIQIIPFLMKNPVFIASFLLVVLTYGISKFGSLNPPKQNISAGFFSSQNICGDNPFPEEDGKIETPPRCISELTPTVSCIVFPFNPLNCQLVVSCCINIFCLLSPIRS